MKVIKLTMEEAITVASSKYLNGELECFLFNPMSPEELMKGLSHEYKEGTKFFTGDVDDPTEIYFEDIDGVLAFIDNLKVGEELELDNYPNYWVVRRSEKGLMSYYHDEEQYDRCQEEFDEFRYCLFPRIRKVVSELLDRKMDIEFNKQFDEIINNFQMQKVS